MLRRKFAASSCTPQTASYTARSSASVNVVPTNAVATPVTSSSTRTRSTASHTICRWSNASSIFPLSTSDTGSSEAAAASDPAASVPTSRSTARYAIVTTFIRGSRSGSPYAPNWVSRLAASTPVSSASSRIAASSSVSAGRLKPPGIAHMPSNGASPRLTSSTCSKPSRMVRMTTSTVTANAGNRDGS